MPQKQRDPFLQTILSLFVPFYILYWLYVTAQDMEKKYNQKAPSIWLLIVPCVITVAFFIYMFVAIATMPVAENGGDSMGGLLFLFLMLGFIFVVLPVTFLIGAIYIYKFSKNANNIVGELNPWLMILLYFIASPVIVYVIQDRLNIHERNLQNSQQALAPNPPTV